MKAFAWLKHLVSPTAVGFMVTLVYCWTAFNYFTVLGKNTQGANPVVQLLGIAHQKSVDFRLKQRGERRGSEQVGLLTVDEKAVATVGRWPWPREVTGKAIDNAVKLGAKVLAFDIVFSEPSAQPALQTLKSVQDKMPLPENVVSAFQDELALHDSDAQMAKVISANSDHLVLGSFGEDGMIPQNESFDYCMDQIFALQPEYEQWVKKEKSAIIVPGGPPELPAILQEFYRKQLQDIATAISENKNVESSVQQYELKAKISEQQLEFCSRLFIPNEDETYSTLEENWSALVETEDASFRSKFPDFKTWVEHMRSRAERRSLAPVYSWTMNLPLLTAGEGTFNTGYFNAVLDADGTIRRSALLKRTGHTIMPSMALKAYLVGTGQSAQVRFKYNGATQVHEVEKLEILNEDGEISQVVPVEGNGRLAINYAGRQKMFPHVSMADLLTDSDTLTYQIREKQADGHWQEIEKTAKKAEFLKDKIFVVGATATGIYDLRVTPFEENYPGAETHVNVIDNLLRKDYLITPIWEERTMLFTLAILGFALTLALTHLGAVPGFSLVLVLLAAISLGDRYFLFGRGIVITIVLPILLVLILFIFLISYKYFTEERHKKELRSTFAKYVSPAIVEEILSDPSKIELGGRKAHVTVFFSDVRGFTTISEKLDPRALSDLLNSYLTPMTDLVFKTRGTLDKYMGDAIMAFFGAPIPHPEHAKDACRCALAHLQKLDELRAEFKRQNLPDIDIGIGLNTGDVSVGNMGSQTVRSYTVMGDAVNLASRLEGINKQYGTRIIISEFTHNEIKDHFQCREIDWVKVKGKVLPVKIFELMSEAPLEPKRQAMIQHFSQGYELYHKSQFQQALAEFNKGLEAYPGDSVCELYVERCQDYIETPPPENWDGVFVMKTK